MSSVETVEIDDMEYVRKEDHDAIIEEQNEQIEEQSSLLEALRNKVTTLETAFNDYRANNEEDKAKIRKFAKEKAEEAGSSDATPGDDDGDTTTQTGETTGNDEPLPIEKLADADDGEYPFPGGKPGPSVERAVEIYKHYRQWSGRKVQAGWTIIEDLKTLLSTATGERLAWKQVYRACKKLETWTNGDVEFRKTDRHGWMLVTDNQRLVQKHSSSANGA
jgi:hypothetical protein